MSSSPLRDWPARQLARIRATGTDPGLLISLRRTVSVITAIPANFPAHRRRRPAQKPGHRPCRLLRRNPSRYCLSLKERQCQPRTTAQSWTDPAARRNMGINRRRRLAKRSTDTLQRLAALPPVPQLRLLRRSKTSTISWTHHNTVHLSV